MLSSEVEDRNIIDFPSKMKTEGLIFKHPPLPVLDSVVRKVMTDRNLLNKFKNTVIVGRQHLFSNFASLIFDGFVKCGTPPENIFFVGKAYSTWPPIVNYLRKHGINIFEENNSLRAHKLSYKELSNQAIDNLWEKVTTHLKTQPIERIIVLDEGGKCIERIPATLKLHYKVAGIEQTRGGLYSPSLKNTILPITLAATSAAKKMLESTCIASTILEKSEHMLKDRNITSRKVCGIIGHGAIGKALAKHLINNQYDVIFYDNRNDSHPGIKGTYRMFNPQLVIENSDVIFCCTGKDLSKEIDFKKIIRKEKLLISCSSERKEFESLIENNISTRHMMDDKRIISESGEPFYILNGGFPINFDRTEISVPNNLIQLTRSLIFASVVQSLELSKTPTNDGTTVHSAQSLMLSPYAQKFIVKEWWKDTDLIRNFDNETISIFQDINLIETRSTGERIDMPIMEKLFGN